MQSHVQNNYARVEVLASKDINKRFIVCRSLDNQDYRYFDTSAFSTATATTGLATIATATATTADVATTCESAADMATDASTVTAACTMDTTMDYVNNSNKPE